MIEGHLKHRVTKSIRKLMPSLIISDKFYEQFWSRQFICSGMAKDLQIEPLNVLYFSEY